MTCHAQQCAEKYLKALLALRAMDFPKTHDLEALAARLRADKPFICPPRAVVSARSAAAFAERRSWRRVKAWMRFCPRASSA